MLKTTNQNFPFLSTANCFSRKLLLPIALGVIREGLQWIPAVHPPTDQQRHDLNGPTKLLRRGCPPGEMEVGEINTKNRINLNQRNDLAQAYFWPHLLLPYFLV